MTYHENRSSTLPVTTPERTALVEQTTPEFRGDLERLSPADRRRIQQVLSGGYATLRENPRAFFARLRRPVPIQLRNGYTSSLYALSVGRDFGIVISVDDDPVFDQTLVTLFRVVQQDELERSFRSTAQLLYGDQIQGNNGARWPRRVPYSIAGV